MGGGPVAALIQNRYEGAVYPVNPRSDTIQGLPAFASVKDIPGTVDLAICTVPPAAVMGVLAECAEKEVGALVVFTSGFAEVGEEGRSGRDGGARPRGRHPVDGPQLHGDGELRESGDRLVPPRVRGGGGAGAGRAGQPERSVRRARLHARARARAFA